MAAGAAATEVYAPGAQRAKAAGQVWRVVVGWMGVLLQILRGTPSWAQVLFFVGLRHPLLSSALPSSSPSIAFKPLPSEIPTDTPPARQLREAPVRVRSKLGRR